MLASKILLVLLSVFVVVTTGCQGSDPQKEMIGKWELDKEATKKSLIETGGEMATALSGMLDAMEMEVEFKSNHSYEVTTIAMGQKQTFVGSWKVESDTDDSVTIETQKEGEDRKSRKKITFVGKDIMVFDSHADRAPNSATGAMIPRLRRVK